MSDDLLQRAANALRETTRAGNPRAGLTRARLLASAERRYAPRRMLGARWLLAFATLMIGGTAMAAQLAGGLPELLQAIAGPPSRPPTSTRAKQRAHPPRIRSAVPAAPAEPAPPVLEPSTPAPLEATPNPDAVRATSRAPDRPRPAPRRRATAMPLLTLPQRTESPSSQLPAGVHPAQPAARAPESAELALFRHAERLHRAHDPAALPAWDAYLRVAGNGPLAPEARYNRALCLVRLGRVDEATAALRPFARGVLHGYRQTEARALLESLTR